MSSNCTVTTCPVSESTYGYRPNVGIDAFFTAAFTVLALVTVLTAFLKRTWVSYSVVMTLGALLEAVGYIGRLIGYNNPWDVTSFSIQYTVLTIAPVFTTAGIYLSIRYLATVMGRGRFNINPLYYPKVFIPSDVLALIIQAAGGAMATSEDSSSTAASGGVLTGTKVTIVGLVLQLISLSIFMVLFLGVVLSHRGQGADGVNGIALYTRAAAKPDDSEQEHPAGASPHPHPRALTFFAIVLFVATLLVIIRSFYRVAELSQGLDSAIAENEWLFIGLDGFMILPATAALVILHPARLNLN